MISNTTYSPCGGDISGPEQYEHTIKLGRCLIKFLNKFSNNISIEIVNLENINRRYNTVLEYEVDIINSFMKRKTTMIITDSLLYIKYCQFYFKCTLHNKSRNLDNIQMENNLSISHYLYLAIDVWRHWDTYKPRTCI